MTLDTLKVAVLLLVVAIAQLTVVNPLQLLDGAPSLLVCALVAIALARGATAGAWAGFGSGLVLDVVSLSSLGQTSLILTLVGYTVGRWGEGTTARRAQLPRVLIATVIATVVLAAVSIVVNFALGADVSLGQVVVRSYLPTLVANLVLAYPVYLLVRRLLPGPERPRGEVMLPVS